MSACPCCKEESISVWQKLRAGRRLRITCPSCGGTLRLSKGGAMIAAASIIPVFAAWHFFNMGAQALVVLPAAILLVGMAINASSDMLECERPGNAGT